MKSGGVYDKARCPERKDAIGFSLIATTSASFSGEKAKQTAVFGT